MRPEADSGVTVGRRAGLGRVTPAAAEVGEIALAARAVLRLLREAGQEAMLERRLHRYSNEFAPQELAEVYGRIAAELDGEARLRVARLAPYWTKLRSKGGAVYRREVLAPGVVLYRSAQQAAERGALVCFTSIRARMFLPNVRFLDMLGHRALDVVMLATPNGTFGRWSLAGGRTFYESLMQVLRILAAQGIVPRTYMGASSGGAPAIQAALLAGDAPAVTMGCRFFTPGRGIALRRAGIAFDPMCGCLAGAPPAVHNIYAKLQPFDAEQNARLCALLPTARGYAIPKDTRHNPVASLTGMGLLSRTMETIADSAFGQAVSFDFIGPA